MPAKSIVLSEDDLAAHPLPAGWTWCAARNARTVAVPE